MSYFIFNGFNTSTTNATVAPESLTMRPSRQFEATSAMGRSGDILRDNSRYANVERSYWVLIPSSFEATYAAFRNALLSPTGYCRLEDSWNPDEYFMAYVSLPLQPTVSRDRSKGKFLVTFSRRPERWYKSGEESISTGGSISILAADMPSLDTFWPLVRLKYGAAISDTDYPVRYEIMHYSVTQPGETGRTYRFYLYKAPSASWSDFFALNDEYSIDFSTGEARNVTKGTDITGIIGREVTDGILPEGEDWSGTTSIGISFNSASAPVSFIPRWYAI